MNLKKFGERLFIALLFCAVLFFIGFPFAGALSLMLILSSILAPDKRSSFLLVSALFLLTSGSLFAVTVNLQSPFPALWETVAQNHHSKISLPNWPAYALSAVFYFLVFGGLQRVANATRGRFALGLVSASLIGFVLAYDVLRDKPILNLILFGTVLALAKSFWFLCCNVRDQALLKDIPITAQFLFSLQPWQQGLAKACVAGGYDIHNSLNKHDSDRSRLQREALYLMIWAGILAKVAQALEQYTIGADGYLAALPMPITRDNYLEGQLSIAGSWLFIGLKCFIFLVEMAAYSHAAVAVGRLLGVRMERNVDQPYKSRSFTDFLKRIYYYYISFLNLLIFYPLWARLGMITHKSTRIFVVTFVTIASGGLITTTLGSVYGLMGMSASQFAGAVLGNFPYFILLGLFAGISSLFRQAGRPQPNGIRLFGKSFCYFWMYAICFSTELGRSDHGIVTRLKATLHLFGL